MTQQLRGGASKAIEARHNKDVVGSDFLEQLLEAEQSLDAVLTDAASTALKEFAAGLQHFASVILSLTFVGWKRAGVVLSLPKDTRQPRDGACG